MQCKLLIWWKRRNIYQKFCLSLHASGFLLVIFALILSFIKDIVGMDPALSPNFLARLAIGFFVFSFIFMGIFDKKVWPN